MRTLNLVCRPRMHICLYDCIIFLTCKGNYMLKNKLFLDHVDVWPSFKSLGFVFNLYTHKLRSEAIANCIKNNNTMYVCLASSSNLYDLKLSKD